MWRKVDIDTNGKKGSSTDVMQRLSGLGLDTDQLLQQEILNWEAQQ